MRSSRLLHFRNPWVIGFALVAGIVCGRLLHASQRGPTPGEPRNGEASAVRPSSAQPVPSATKARGRPPEGSAIATPDPADYFIVPPEALRRIRVDLMDGTSLNLKECGLLGLEESQIQELKLMVDSTVLRWQEREKATMKILPSTGPGTLLHIPHTAPAIAEKEWQDLKAGILRIAGPDLDPLLHYRLTDGYSPSQQSNAGTGMLNVLTAGYGTLDRLVKITLSGGGTPIYEIIDYEPTRLKDGAPDEAFFRQLKDSGSHEGSRYFPFNKVPEQLVHLLPLK